MLSWLVLSKEFKGQMGRS